MSYTVAEMFNLFQFAKGYSGLAICRLTKISPRTMDTARSEDVLTKLVNGRMVKHFGPDWNSTQNLRDYQRKKNIADSIDHERLARLRQEQKRRNVYDERGNAHKNEKRYRLQKIL